MKKILIGALLSGLVSFGYAQRSEIDFQGFNYLEFKWEPINNDYLQKVADGSKSLRVKAMEQKVSGYKYLESPFYDARSLQAGITFRRNNDFIEAVFDRRGNLLKTYEEYKDLMLPLTVRNSIYKSYPGWNIEADTYKVVYNRGTMAEKFYKVRLEKDHFKKVLKIKA